MARELQVVVTGASSGIGAGLSLALAESGHRIWTCARRKDRLRKLEAQSDKILGRVCDVRKESEVRRFANWVRGRAGRVDVLINCAAAFGSIGPIWETDTREWRRTIEVNLVGTYLMIKHLFPLIEKAQGARIINFSGGGAFQAFPHYSAYGASKAAVVGLTETLAQELSSRGIAVNAVAPGFVSTEIHDATLRAGVRSGRAHLAKTRQLLREGAVPMTIPIGLVRFLVSPEADGLTGKTISARFDPWDAEIFRRHITQINKSELYTQRRVNLENLPTRQRGSAWVKAMGNSR